MIKIFLCSDIYIFSFLKLVMGGCFQRASAQDADGDAGVIEHVVRETEHPRPMANRSTGQIVEASWPTDAGGAAV
jgi:hypothetical protein